MLSPVYELEDGRSAWGSVGWPTGVMLPERVLEVDDVRRLRRRVLGGEVLRVGLTWVEGERALDELPRR